MHAYLFTGFLFAGYVKEGVWSVTNEDDAEAWRATATRFNVCYFNGEFILPGGGNCTAV
jgi:hypothetical protein